MNNDIEYELLAKSIYETLLHKDGVTTDVKHNVILKGKAAEHQIDVYWEYRMADTLFRVAIECKNYNSRVTIGKVRDFHSVLNDIGNIQGIMVSRKGFQSGAKEYAEHYGINLKEIREPEDTDWNGRIKTIVMKMNMITTHIRERKINIDDEWMTNNDALPKGTTIQLQINDTTDNIWLIDNLGNKTSNFYQLDEKLPTDMRAAEKVIYKYEFDNAFLENTEGIKFKVSSIEYVYDVIESTMPDIVIDGAQTAKAIIKDAFNGSIKFVNNNGVIK
ncbi:hypothetical protein KML24008_22280 [Alistipes onderdonkii]|uniref:restriction endonuclease n=1 Tax=Alistipes onderdonkii TaxID=328813 RepID=UPI0036F204E5